MKKYEVELKRESYVLYTVEANSPEEAEDKAWKELESDYTHSYGEWTVEFVQEKPQYRCVCGCTEPPEPEYPGCWPSCPRCGMI